MSLRSIRRRPAPLLAALLFFASLLLYLVTLAPSVVTIFDDSLEFQLVAYQLGVAHPTGYPLYTLLGHLFTWLPVGNVAYRVNLLSAVFGAATVAWLYLLILPLTQPARAPVSPPAWPWTAHAGAIIGALLLAVSGVFWRQATIAEVYTLNAFFVVLLLGVAVQARPEAPQVVLWLAFLFGLSLTHHRTMLLLLPALLFHLFLIYKFDLFKPGLLLKSVGLGLLPLLLYLYLPWRGDVGSLDGTYQNSWAGFWRQVTASGYGGFIFGNPFGHERDFFFYWNLLADQVYTTAPGLIGLLYLARLGRRRLLGLTGLAFLSYTLFNLFYNVTDIEVFFIPVFLLWAAWSGVGAAFLLRTMATLKLKRSLSPEQPAAGQVDERSPSPETGGDQATPAPPQKSVPTLIPQRWRLLLTGSFLAIFLFMIGQLGLTTWPVLAERNNWRVHDYGLDMLRQIQADEPAAVVGILGEMTLLRYFQQTEGLRPNLETVAADAEAERLAAVAERLAQDQTVYLTRPLPGAAERWSLSAAGPLIRVDPTPRRTPPPVERPVDQAVTPEISLLGYTISRPPHTGSGPAPVRLTLVWRAEMALEADLKVSARLLNPAGQPQAVVDAGPVHFAYPTSAWRPGEIIVDGYDLGLPPDAPAGSYTPLIIWYDPAQNAAELGRIELPPLEIGPGPE